MLAEPCKIMVNRAAERLPSLPARLKSWPRKLHVADMFTGVGTFKKVMDAAFDALKNKFGDSLRDVEEGWGQRTTTIC